MVDVVKGECVTEADQARARGAGIAREAMVRDCGEVGDNNPACAITTLKMCGRGLCGRCVCAVTVEARTRR